MAKSSLPLQTDAAILKGIRAEMLMGIRAEMLMGIRAEMLMGIRAEKLLVQLSWMLLRTRLVLQLQA